jgi:hypothetical protein
MKHFKTGWCNFGGAPVLDDELDAQNVFDDRTLASLVHSAPELEPDDAVARLMERWADRRVA